MRFRGYVVSVGGSNYTVRVTGISHVAFDKSGSEVAYSQSKAGMRRMLKAHKEGRTVKEEDKNGRAHTWTKGAYAL